VDDQLQQDRRYVELKQRRDGMWQLEGRLTSTVGAQLNTILDPLAKPRTGSIENEDGSSTEIPDDRPAVQRMHDGLDEACGRLLKSADQPSVGGSRRQSSPPSGSTTCSPRRVWRKPVMAASSRVISCCGSLTKPTSGPR